MDGSISISISLFVIFLPFFLVAGAQSGDAEEEFFIRQQCNQPLIEHGRYEPINRPSSSVKVNEEGDNLDNVRFNVGTKLQLHCQDGYKPREKGSQILLCHYDSIPFWFPNITDCVVDG